MNRTLQAAYLPCNVSAKAAVIGLSRRQVRRASKATMFAALEQQNEFMESVAKSGARFKLSWERIEFDETKQKLQVRSHQDLLACQQTASWSVMVCCHEFGWIGDDGGVNILDVLRLNKILVGSCTSGCIWDALTGGAEITEAKRWIDEIRSRSDDTFLVWEPDAASPNLKLCPFQVDELRRSDKEFDRKTLFDTLVCGLHQSNHIVQVVCSSSSSMAFIRGLHSLALLTGEGNYFMRLVLVVVQVLRRCLSVSRCPPGSLILNTYARCSRKCFSFSILVCIYQFPFFYLIHRP